MGTNAQISSTEVRSIGTYCRHNPLNQIDGYFARVIYVWRCYCSLVVCWGTVQLWWRRRSGVSCLQMLEHSIRSRFILLMARLETKEMTSFDLESLFAQ